MKLPINLPGLFEKKPAAEYFLALLLRDEKATAVIFEEIAGKVKIVGKYEAHFSTSLEEASQEELLDIIDKAISRAEETLPANVQTQKTIFGLKDTWIEDKKIKKDYLAKLKTVSDELTLTPIGFLVISEAISHLIQREEGAPVSAILAELGNKSITLSLFRAGKLLETKTAAMTESPAKTVDSLLKHFERVEVLPSRIILFNAENNEELSQQFIAHQWSKSLPFLHMPQVSLLPGGFDAKSVLYGAATQLGFEIIGVSMDEPIPAAEIPHISRSELKKHHEAPVEAPATPHVEHKKEEEPQEEQPEDTTDEIPAASFGFVMDQEITEVTPVAPAPTPVSEETPDEEEPEAPKHIVHDNIAPVHESHEEKVVHHTAPTKSPKIAFSLASLTPLLATVQKQMTLLKLRGIRMPTFDRGNKMMFIPPVVLILLIAGILLYVFKMQATVVLNLQPKVAEETEKITFSTTSDNDFSRNIIAVTKVSTEVEGSVTVEATGEKEIGNKAKGTVTIFNNSESRRTLKEGSTITSSNNLVFVLDKDVTIASASGDAFSGTKPGTAQIAVTAQKIGSDYNLPSNTKFSVDGAGSSVAARNDSAFSGGSKKSVVVVSKKDIDNAKAELPKKLEQQAREKLHGDLESGATLLPEFLKVTLKDAEQDADVDEEADEVTLTAKVTFDGAAYNKNDLITYAQSILKDKFSQDTTIPESSIDNTISNISQKNDKEITANLVIKAGLLPKIETNEVANDITGMSFTEAEEELTKLPQVESVEIKLSPDIPLLPRILPRVANNIKVTIHTNE